MKRRIGCEEELDGKGTRNEGRKVWGEKHLSDHKLHELIRTIAKTFLLCIRTSGELGTKGTLM